MTTYKGYFSPKNYKKYEGDPTNIVYRSSWERSVMSWLDDNKSVLSWSSEEVVIPYISPIDNRKHRYFPDFKATIRNKDGIVKTYLIEVKPYKETMEPKKQKRVTKRYITEVTTWGVNSSKWEAARAYCAQKGWEFMIITEKELGRS